MNDGELLSGKRCFCSWSGGKDSCLSLYRAQKLGADVRYLINMRVESGDRSRSHGLASSVIEAQANSLGIELGGIPVSWQDYEDRFVSVLKVLRAEGIEAGIFGDIDIQDHLDWERMVCEKTGMTASLPLWQEDRMDVVKGFIDAGFIGRIVSLKEGRLSPDFLGRAFSMDLIDELQGLGIDPCGEAGEFHTVVTDGPNFSQPVKLVPGERVLRSGYWFLDFKVGS